MPQTPVTIYLVGEHNHLLDNRVEDCNDVGPHCYSCQYFDTCDHHFDEDDNDVEAD